jgi:hypothetical protein
MDIEKNSNIKTIPKLRFEFVGMLFALAIGEVAIEISKLLCSNLPISLWYYSLTHLILATFIIAMSWIGWQSSKSYGNIVTIDSIFSFPFIILLIDITLVIIYFIIANGGEHYISESKSMEKASAKNETFWVMIIFIIYFIWDIVTKSVVILYEKDGNGRYKKKYKCNFSELFNRSIATIFCLIVSVYFYLHYLGKDLTGIQVLFVDVNLLLLFLLFRGWKQKLILVYSINEHQLQEKVIKESNIVFDEKSEITVFDSKTKLIIKKFLFRYFPVILIVFLEFINNKVL